MNIAIRHALNTGAKLARGEGRIRINRSRKTIPSPNRKSSHVMKFTNESTSDAEIFCVKCLEYDINGHLSNVTERHIVLIDED